MAVEEKGQVIPAPDRGLTTEEREAKHKRQLAEWEARRARWIEAFQAGGRDASRLPRLPKEAIYTGGQSTLTAALGHADLVAEGTIAKVIYTPADAVGTVRLGAVHKVSGTACPTEAEVALGYTVGPGGPDFPEGLLGFSEAQPVLLPGARAVLFLELREVRGQTRFYIQSFTGGYEIDPGGKIIPVPGNPFAAQVRGLAVERFSALVVRGLGSGAP